MRTLKRKFGHHSAKVGDAARFLRSWSRRPLVIGSVTPSGPNLSRAMAAAIDPEIDGPVIEIGPGTGPVTKALIQSGIAESRLVLVEYSADFVKLLRARYPRATVVQGDAYGLKKTLSGILKSPAIGVVSSLPLLTRPETERVALLRQAFELMLPGMPFVQFTYGVTSPVPIHLAQVVASVSPRVWLNVPPARVWTYRQNVPA
jgi:phosphatidylethanolamine/phosphatidyl-N-methylethanolamine N-methyltransferase